MLQAFRVSSVLNSSHSPNSAAASVTASGSSLSSYIAPLPRFVTVFEQDADIVFQRFRPDLTNRYFRIAFSCNMYICFHLLVANCKIIFKHR